MLTKEEKGKRISEAKRGKIPKNLAYLHRLPRNKLWRERMSKAIKGIKRSEEVRKKVSVARLARKKRLGYINSLKTRKKMSEVHMGRKLSEEHKRKVSEGMRGKKNALGYSPSEETRKKLSISNKGEKSYLWQGGKSFEPYTIDWTETLKRSIRERDHYICQLCFQYGNNVHHIDYNKKNCNPNNLITLCRPCHLKTNLNRDYWIKFFGIKKDYKEI